MSGAIKVVRTEHDATALRGLAARARDAAQSRRLLAIAIILDGSSRLDAARQAGMDRQTLRDWVHRYNEDGVDGLLSRQAPGPAPKLTKAQMDELRDLVLKGPDPATHQVVRWRCVDLRREVACQTALNIGSDALLVTLIMCCIRGVPRADRVSRDHTSGVSPASAW